MTNGMVVYKKVSTNSRYYKAQRDGTAEESGFATGVDIGIVLSGNAAAQSGLVQFGGFITIGGTMVLSGVYVLSDTAGAICPFADYLAGSAGNYLTLIGAASTTLILEMWCPGVYAPTLPSTGYTHA